MQEKERKRERKFFLLSYFLSFSSSSSVSLVITSLPSSFIYSLDKFFSSVGSRMASGQVYRGDNKEGEDIKDDEEEDDDDDDERERKK